MATSTALYDACVLYPACVRDLLMQLATTGLFRAKWTDQIHKEWIRGVLESRPDLTREKLERVRDLMDEHVLDCKVTDYEDLIPALQLPDPDDRHVLAAAIRGRADVIVTKNLKHFPTRVLDRYGIEPQHPDEFLTHLLDLNQATVCGDAQTCRLRKKNPPKTAEEYLAELERQELPETVCQLREFRKLI